MGIFVTGIYANILYLPLLYTSEYARPDHCTNGTYAPYHHRHFPLYFVVYSAIFIVDSTQENVHTAQIEG